ncbi:MAG: HDOD domain-containing protein [Rhodocyclaceae bacterium]
MLRRIVSALFGRTRSTQARAEAEHRDFQALNAAAPVLGIPGASGAVPDPGQSSFICREALLNRDQRVAGYEFMLRRSARGRVLGQSRRIHHVYSDVVVGNMVQFSIGRLLGHRKAFVAVLDSFLDNPAIDQLPGAGVVLIIQTLADAHQPADLEPRIVALKERGFRFALDDLFEGAIFDRLAPHAEYFLVQSTAHTPAGLRRLAERLAAQFPRVSLVAKDLESFDDFELCRKLGFAMFHGPFVTSREDWSGNHVGPQALRVIDLLNRLRRDADTAELARILRQDAVLSYRLLRYINSAASGLGQPVTSIEQGLMIMGRQKIYRWLTLLLFGSAEASPRTAALLENALVRGRLMERVDERQPEAAREDLFVVGLFSLLDRVLQVPMPEALKPLNLPEAVRAALLQGTGPYASLLGLATACEAGDQEGISAASVACGLNAARVNAQHFEALIWAQDVQN